jgi:hypothetical protein
MKKINSTLSSLLMLLVFIICIPFTGQLQTVSATSGSISFENSNHVVNGISLSQDVTDFLSVGIKMKNSINQEIPVLFVDTKGSVVSEEEWNNIFPALGDPDTYVVDHEVIVAQYSKADYKKMIKASEKKIEMYEKDALESVNASILYHMLHDKKHDKKSNKKDK